MLFSVCAHTCYEFYYGPRKRDREEKRDRKRKKEIEKEERGKKREKGKKRKERQPPRLEPL